MVVLCCQHLVSCYYTTLFEIKKPHKLQLTDWSLFFFFFNSKVSNLKSLSKIGSRNDSNPDFEDLASKKRKNNFL